MSTTTTALSSAGKTTDAAANNSADTFASLFEASIQAGDFGKEGEIVKGTVVAVLRDNVIIDIGGKSEGIIALAEFTDPSLPPGSQTTVKPGDNVDVYIESRENDDGLVMLSKEKADKMKVWDEISAACERDELIEGTISQRVKGGLSVTIRGGVKAFLPGSQVDLRPIRNLDKLIGQTYQFKVIKVNKKRGNIVLFVDLGGIDGLLHITDMSWGRVNHPSEIFQVGDEVTVRVLK
jgi:small subunit ribosomal protein S1